MLSRIVAGDFISQYTRATAQRVENNSILQHAPVYRMMATLLLGKLGEYCLGCVIRAVRAV